MGRRRGTVSGPTERVVIIGAGLGGLSAALRLTGAGRSVRILESGTQPGGLMGRWESGGYRFDTGPTVLTMPGLIDDALACVGETRSDWLDLVELVPSYRAQFADSSVLRSFTDTSQMADEVARVCGASEARNYRRLVGYLTALYGAEFDTFMDRNLDSVTDLIRPEAITLLRLGGLRGLDRMVGRYLSDDRLRRLFTFQSMYAGLAPARARAIYGVIAYLDSVSGVWFPRGGMHQVALALAGAGEKHGTQISYQTRATSVEFTAGRASAVITDAGERIPTDVVIVNSDLQAAYRELLPAGLRPWQARRPRHSPSAFVWHVGSGGELADPAHHSISFGTAWSTTFDEIINQGRLMSDPSLLITSPTVTDPTLAPAGRHTYYVLAPAPNTCIAEIDWPRIGPRYVEEISRVLTERGFDAEGAFSSGVEASRFISPADWQSQGLGAGSPFALAHTLTQTGPLRHPTQHPAVDNLLFCGAGVQPGVGIPTVLLSGRLAALRVTS
ncbi:MAG: phytoene desaturase [Pseudonocardiales bacterium]|jgi:phytoene desaturase|nr:phytoene desaturase [Pseudonocardiales bacterium]